MSFEGSGAGQFTLPMDTSVESGGEDNGFRPIELLLVGLAGCTAMDVISILQKKRQEVTAFEVRVVEADRAADHPRVYTHIVLEYVVTGHNVDRAAVERAVELSETKYCSAGGMLGKVAKIENTITVLEAETA
ncbi:MAG TPA: OsmC family protein [Anaerolineaceae bacterium]